MLQSQNILALEVVQKTAAFETTDISELKCADVSENNGLKQLD